MAEKDTSPEHLSFIYGIEPGQDRASFIKSRTTFTTFAVLHGGEWYERGRMGWWGVVHDERADEEWSEQWMSLVLGLPNDAVLALVDVHI